MAWSPGGSCPWSGSLLSPLTEPRHRQCTVVKGSSLSTQLERVKEFWETKQNKQKNLMYSEEKGEKEKGLGEKRIFLRLSVNLCKK